MKLSRSSTLISLCLPLLFLALRPAAAQETSTAAYGEVPEEVVIKAEAAAEIRTRKPPLKVKTDNLESIKKSFESDKNLFLFESGDFVSFSRNYPEKLLSARVIKPWLTSFSDRTVITFYPLRKFEEVFSRTYSEKTAKALQWTLSITDEEGKIFHKYTGSGLPPESISWSGENDQREWVRAGHSYAPMYVFTDEYGAPKTVIGELVRFYAIVYQKGSRLTVSLDSSLLFGPNKSAKVVDKEKGESLLAATGDLIKRRYYNMPLKVNVYAQTKALAETQAGLIKQYLKNLLMCPENLLSYEGFDDTFAQQRADIVLLNK
ncbi:MAG TPA: hypothetical protein PKI19_05915 [Elusimicrobiales bacterium]|nr:hypothetical protein [Elusimicrobiales bacterium]